MRFSSRARRSLTSAMDTRPRALRGATPASHPARPGAATERPRSSPTLTRSSGLVMGAREERWPARRPASGMLTAVAVRKRLVGLDDLLHEPVPDDVAVVEVRKGNALDGADDLHGFDEPRHPARGQIDLRDVAGNHRLRSEPQAREKHLHLLRRRVLRLVEDDE